MNWDDQSVGDALATNRRKKGVVSALWREERNTTFALSAMKER